MVDEALFYLLLIWSLVSLGWLWRDLPRLSEADRKIRILKALIQGLSARLSQETRKRAGEEALEKLLDEAPSGEREALERVFLQVLADLRRGGSNGQKMIHDRRS